MILFKDKASIFSTDFGSRIFGLDIMRTIAILMVVVAHSITMLTPYMPKLAFLSLGGFLGVEIFFVLSGFLIGYILIREINEHPFNLDAIIHFWTRRWFRTLPNYFLILFLNIGLFLVLGRTFHFSLLPYFLFIQNFKKPFHDFFLESWSLSVEEWFYLLVPITLFLVSILYKGEDKKIVIKTTLIIFFLFPLLFRFYQGMRMDLPSTREAWDYSIRKVVVARLDALMFGVLMAYLKYYHTIVFQQYKNVMFGLGCMVLAGCLYFSYYSPINLYFKTLYFSCYSTGFALLIPNLNSIKTGVKVVVVPITYISIISYSIYLLHFSLILLPIEQYIITYNFFGAVLVFLSYWIITIVLSTLLYSFYEKPMTGLREKIAPKRLPTYQA